MLGTQDSPFTHGDPAVFRGRKWCRCSECGVVAVCAPSFDFYTRGKNESGPLVCEACLHGVPHRNLHVSEGAS